MINRQYHWKSFDADGTIWFEDELELDAIINYKEASESSVKKHLVDYFTSCAFITTLFSKKQ